MVKENYQIKIDSKKMAKAMLKNKRISLKYSTELCRILKGKPIDKALAFLNKIISGENFLPLRRYIGKSPHRKGKFGQNGKIGKYPLRVCNTFIELINSVKNNAVSKGMDGDKLIIKHLFASVGFRRRGMQSKGHISGKVHKRKSTHLEIAVMETT